MANSFVMNVVVVAMAGDEDDVSHRRQPNRQRQRGTRGQNLLEDYFVDHPIFSEVDFRRSYRMSINLFNRMKTMLCNHDECWHQRRDTAGVLGLLPEQKMTAAIMLAYGSSAELIRMGESTTLECKKKCCAQVVDHYKDRYLRSTNAAGLSRLLHRAERRGFPGMIGSIECMYWECKNCPTAWQGAYSGRKGCRTIILEAVASYDTCIWHSFIGVPGAQNNINVLYQSDIFDTFLARISPQVTYKVNGNTYDAGYYLADGIYPTLLQTMHYASVRKMALCIVCCSARYSSFVKTITNPQGDPEKLFAKKQESYRKDVESCFGILQPRWAIVRHACMCHRKSVLKMFMLAWIIMHNMIVEEEIIDDEYVEVEEEDPPNPYSAFTVYDGPTDQNGNRYLHDPVGRAQ